MANKKVLVIQAVHEDGLNLLRARDDIETIVTQEVAQAALVDAVASVHALVVRTAVINETVIDAAPALEVVSRHGVGYDAVDVAALTRRGIPLTIATNGNAIAVAEHALYFMLALAKCGRPYDNETRAGNFAIRDKIGAFELHGRRLLIIGFGRIGTRVAALAQAFAMDVHVYDPYIDQAAIATAGCTAVNELHAALPDMDVVSIHCPLTTETRAMIDASELRRMKANALVINCARGGIVHEQALSDAIAAGRIGGAGLDVFEGEPAHPAPGHSLFGFDNVMVTPHTAGVSLEAARRMATQSVHNVLDTFDGKLDPDVVVNREVLG
ncbi:MAG: hydroxyacid dehydrogenase [Gammaproteobacteria bacterium]